MYPYKFIHLKMFSLFTVTNDGKRFHGHVKITIQCSRIKKNIVDTFHERDKLNYPITLHARRISQGAYIRPECVMRYGWRLRDPACLHYTKYLGGQSIISFAHVLYIFTLIYRAKLCLKCLSQFEIPRWNLHNVS